MRSLEGANCANLPGFVIDKYFDCDVGKQPLRAMVGFAICRRCVVQEACRDEALTIPGLPKRGIIGGVRISEVRRARQWLAYESGETDRVPNAARPDWLEMSEAAQLVEQMRVEEDPDVPNE